MCGSLHLTDACSAEQWPECAEGGASAEKGTLTILCVAEYKHALLALISNSRTVLLDLA